MIHFRKICIFIAISILIYPNSNLFQHLLDQSLKCMGLKFNSQKLQKQFFALQNK